MEHNGDSVPPHSTDAEMAVLGSMLLSRDAAGTAVELLREHHFYHARHREFFHVLRELYGEGIMGDEMVAQEELKKRGKLVKIGGTKYIGDVISRTPSFANAENYCRIVLEKARVREYIELLADKYQAANEDGVDLGAEVGDLEAKLIKIDSVSVSTGPQDIKDIMQEAMDEIEEIHNDGKGRLYGIRTGFSGLDALLGGLRKSELIIAAGRPSMGKTSLALNIALTVAEQDHQVQIFSAEMNRHDLSINMMCMAGSINSILVRQGKLDKQEYIEMTKTAAKLSRYPIIIDDTPAIHLHELQSKARRLAVGRPPSLIVVDYIQLLQAPGEKKHHQIDEIARGLKALARELEVPVLAISQLNRDPEKRGDRRPMLADLRESGGLEEAADAVLLIYRPEYYAPEDEDLNGLTSINLAKQRNGPTGRVHLHFEKQHMSFTNLHGNLSEYQLKKL